MRIVREHKARGVVAEPSPAAVVRAELLRWANEPTKDRGSEAFDLDSGYELARKHVREMLATQNPPAAAVPEGYALVPVEPTEAIKKAFWSDGSIRNRWAAMLAAAKENTND